VVGSLILLAGCTASARDPIGQGGEGGGPPDVSGGGGTGGSGGTGAPIPAALVGRWQNTLIVQTVGDIVTVTTTWTFAGNGACQREVRSLSALVGVPVTAASGCSYTVGNFVLNVRFTGSTAPVTYDFSFVPTGTARLRLGGIDYDRLP
jgi:hypothetical protein